MKTIGLFSGGGGFEVAALAAGHSVLAMAEIDPHACAVLADRFPGIPNIGDVTRIGTFDDCDLITAGFPCQDLSQAGRTRGIHGDRSGTVRHVFETIRRSGRKPEFLLFENVPFLLSLDKGAGMTWLVSQVEALGYRWAYRVIDTNAFGLAQRRQRVFFLASLTHDPASVLLASDAARPTTPVDAPVGFYWTEGRAGIGWAPDAIPPLKSMSAAAVLSSPGIWFPETGAFAMPGIEDGEALQGFERGWTRAATNVCAKGERLRWKVVGNAVSVPVIEWIYRGLSEIGAPSIPGTELSGDARWPKAAHGGSGRRFAVPVGDFPVAMPSSGIASFVKSPVPLSERQMRGFLSRLSQGTLKADPRFVADMKASSGFKAGPVRGMKRSPRLPIYAG